MKISTVRGGTTAEAFGSLGGVDCTAMSVLKGHSGMVYCVCFSPDGSKIASGGWDGTIRLWDASTGMYIHTIGRHIGVVTSVCFSPDGSKIASGGDGTIRLWDASTGMHLYTLRGHSGGVLSVCFSPDGSKIASGCMDKTIRLWDVSYGRHIIEETERHQIMRFIEFLEGKLRGAKKS